MHALKLRTPISKNKLQTRGTSMKRLLLIVAVFIFFPHAPSRADVVFTLGNAVIPTGGSGSIDVMITTSGTTESFAQLEFEFLTSPLSIANLWFVNPQSESFASTPGYIFAGNSEAAASGVAVTNIPDSSRLIFSDSTADGSNITLSPGDSFLMATLEFFSISENPETFFIDISGWVRQADGTRVNYGRNFGRVDVVAVPEPGTFGMLGLAGAASLALRIRRKGQT